MNTKLSLYTPSLTPSQTKEDLVALEVSTLTKITIEKICLGLDVIHVKRKDTMLYNVIETKMSLTIRRETREYIMLMLQRMMNLPQRELDMKVKILQVMKNIF